jgi:hypothetical protein
MQIGYAPVSQYDSLDHGYGSYGKQAQDYGSYGHANKGIDSSLKLAVWGTVVTSYGQRGL